MKPRPTASPRKRPSRDYPTDDARLASALAEDLEDHLSGIQRRARRLGERMTALGGGPLERTAAAMLQAAEQMSSLVADFLAAKAGGSSAALPGEPVDLAATAAAVANRFRETARRKGIALSLATRRSAVIVRGHRTAIDQVLANLISNALKFSPPGKRVWVRVTTVAGSGRCEVRDEGPGLTALDRRRLFRRRRRLSARPTGGESSTGLGLSIAKKLADRMGGRLQCESTPGRGAAFSLTLPDARRSRVKVRRSLAIAIEHDQPVGSGGLRAVAGQSRQRRRQFSR